jgi:transcriptional regulator with XRE-family HTH domain
MAKRSPLAEAITRLGAGEVARLLGVSRRTVERWRTGQVRPDGARLAELSSALGLPLDQVVRDIFG